MARVFVVGGNSGIGLETVKLLLEEGHEVTAAARSSAPLSALGVDTQEFEAATCGNLAIPESLDALAYFPGTINLKPFGRLDDEAFLADFQVNVLGAINVIRQALPSLKKASAPASVLLFSTVAVQVGMPFHTSVAAAKGAIEGLTRSLAAEFAPAIRVNAIAPSLTDTPLASRLLSDNSRREAARSRHPLNRIATADEVARLAAFLLGAKSAPLTGQILHPDNGLSSLRLF